MEIIRCPIWVDHNNSVDYIRDTCAKDCIFVQKGDRVIHKLTALNRAGTFVRIVKSDSEFDLPIALIEWEDHHTQDIICLYSKEKYDLNDIDYYTREIDVQ